MTGFVTQRRNVEKMFKKRAFAGHYVERRLINEQRGYRDVVWLSPEESELAADLSFASEVCQSLSADIFTSYSAQPVPSIWVTLSDVPLGCHWFQITSVVLNENELTFHLKSLRSFPGVKFKKTEDFATDLQFSFENFLESFQKNVKAFVSSINTDTIISIFKFFVILITTLATGVFQLIFFLGDFSIKLMRELSIFVNASTPFMLGCLEFVSKLVGGFYILLAMLWRGSAQPRPNFIPAIAYKSNKSPHKTEKYPHYYK